MERDIEKRIDSIYDSYLNTIAPYIVQIETYDSEFPIEILNEIRSIFTHLARIHVEDMDGEAIEYNMKGAERHVKRALLDCYKYLCLSVQEKYTDFMRLYNDVDITYVERGTFSFTLGRLKGDFESVVIEAKNLELHGISEESEIYTKWETAFIKGDDLKLHMESAHDECEFVRMKNEGNQKKQEFYGKASVAGFIVGAVGIIFAIITLLT